MKHGCALVLLAACGASGHPDAPRTEVPASLARTWQYSHLSSLENCDELGRCEPAYGFIETYRFEADGHFAYAQLYKQNVGNCKQASTIDASGGMTVEGATLTFYFTSARQTHTDTCAPSKDFDLEPEISPSSCTYSVQSGSDGPLLGLAGADGELSKDPLGQSIVYGVTSAW